MTEHSISLSRCTYLVGRATLPLEGLPGLVEGINFLRDHGVAIWAGTYIKRGGVVVPLALRCDSAAVSLGNDDAVETTKEVVRKTLDGCWVAWKVVRPRASSEKSIRICRRVDAVADDLAHLTLADITPAEAVDDPFRNLVGMKPQVELLRTISDAAAAYGRGSLESLHMVFEGKPGTGKTELARRTSAYMHKCGLTSGKFVKASAADLIAKHVGQTPGLVRAAFDRAEGGVLFIDEAYSLTQGPGNEFGVEAANTLVECMDERRDAYMAASEMALMLEHLGRTSTSEYTTVTVGRVDVIPNAVNVIPGCVKFSIDIRDCDFDKKNELIGRMKKALSEIAERRGVTYELTEYNNDHPMKCEPAITQKIEAACKAQGISYEYTISGAFHDSMLVGEFAPVAMIFVPSKDGISHSPEEWTDYDDLAAGTDVLADTLIAMANE